MSIESQWKCIDIEHYKTVEKIQELLKKEDSDYFCGHPEIRAVIRTLLHEAINSKSEDPAEISANVFDCNINRTLKIKIDQERKYVINELKKGNWDVYDYDNLYRTNSSHSLLSQTSLSSDLNTILRFCLIIPPKK